MLLCQMISPDHADGASHSPLTRPRSWIMAVIMLTTICVMGARLGIVDYSQVSRITLFSQVSSQNGLRLSSSQASAVVDDSIEKRTNPACEALQNAHNFIAKSNIDMTETERYDWIGNQWFPPPSIPRYTPNDMRALLQGENVLFIGDSTARQDYATMFNLMNAASHAHDIAVDELDKGININKMHKTENCTLRRPAFHKMLSVCRQVPAPSGREQDTEHTRRNAVSTISKTTTASTTGAFDLSTNPEPCNCFSNIPIFIERFQDIITQQYSVLIFSLGIWESVKADACPDSGTNALMQCLEFLKDFTVANPSIMVVWKTHGGGELETSDERQFTLDIHRQTQDWFQLNYPKNMALVDFGTQVRRRTYDDKRIGGDSHNHFGLDARLLSLQMLVQGIAETMCGV